MRVVVGVEPVPGRIWEGYLPSSPWPRTSNAFAHLSLTPRLIGLFLALTYGLSVGPFGPPTPNGSVDCQPDFDRILVDRIVLCDLRTSGLTVRLSSAARLHPTHFTAPFARTYWP